MGNFGFRPHPCRLEKGKQHGEGVVAEQGIKSIEELVDRLIVIENDSIVSKSKSLQGDGFLLAFLINQMKVSVIH